MKQGVTFVVTAEVLGGGELYLLRFAQALQERMPVRVVGRHGTPVLLEAAKRDLTTESLNLGQKLGSKTAFHNALRYPVAKRRLKALVERSPDHLFVFQYKWEQMLWAGRYARQRVILWEHGPISGEVLKLRFSRRRLRDAYMHAGVVFAMNDTAREAIRQLCGRDVELLPAGLDLSACNVAVDRRMQTRSDLRVSESTPLFSFVGRATVDKGLLHAIRAFANASPTAILVVCGDGDAQQAGEQLAEDLRVADRVLWLGWCENTLEILAAADATLLLSVSEGRPLVALESLAVGTPVVGLATTPALGAMASVDGIYLANDLSLPAIAAAIGAAMVGGRPIPSGSDWADSVNRFVATIDSVRQRSADTWV